MELEEELLELELEEELLELTELEEDELGELEELSDEELLELTELLELDDERSSIAWMRKKDCVGSQAGPGFWRDPVWKFSTAAWRT